MKDGFVAGVYLSVVLIVVAFFVGYSDGKSSKQPYIDSLNQQTSSLNFQVRKLEAGCEVTLCVDGSCSFSTGSGTCSWHHGAAY